MADYIFLDCNTGPKSFTSPIPERFFNFLDETTGPKRFTSPIPERFFNNIDAAAEEYMQNRKEHSLATIAGILGVDTISKDSPEYKNIAEKIKAYATH